MIPALFLSPLFRKVALYGAIILGVLYLVRWYSNRQWSQGYDEGKISGIAEIEKAKAAEWAEREAAVHEAGIVAAQKDAQASAALQQALSARNDARRTLDTIIAQSQGRSEATHSTAITITPDAIDDALRSLSASLGPPLP